MDYDSIDWEAEAKRVTFAFGARGPCEFVENERGQKVLCGILDGRELAITPELWLEVVYDSERRAFYLATSVHWMWVRIYLDGREPYVKGDICEEAMARSLLLLGLLSPEIEAALGVNFSAHQKLEWLVGFEEKLRNNYGL